MSNAKWTPGPWFAVNVGSKDEPMMSVKAARIAGKPPRHEVALCATGDSPQEMENANARLIAAAPELYDALKWLVDDVQDYEAWQRPCAAFDAAVAALTKARGEG